MPLQFAIMIMLCFTSAEGSRNRQSLDEEMQADETMCHIKGPTGSGVSYAMSIPAKSCKFKCRQAAIFGKDEHFEKAFEATHKGDDKCLCSASQGVTIVGLDHKGAADLAAITWVQPFVKEGDCTPSICWDFYKSAYDVGRHRNEMLRSAGPKQWSGTCSDDVPAGFTFGTTIFYHVRRQAVKKPIVTPVHVDAPGVVDPPLEEAVVEPQQTLLSAVSLNTALAQDLSVGSRSPIEIQNAADMIVQSIEVVQDPWSGFDSYLADIRSHCNIDASDLKKLQDVGEWCLAPEKLHLEKVCQADAAECGGALDTFHGMQADGCDDGDAECEDALDKVQRLMVSFGWCKAADEERKHEAVVQEALRALQAPLESCDVTKKEMMHFNPDMMSTLVSQFPKVCAATKCEDSIRDFAGAPKCNDVRCEDATFVFSNLVAVMAHCRYIVMETQ